LAGTDLSGVTRIAGGDCEYKETRSLGMDRFLVMFYRYHAEEDEQPRNAISKEMVAKVRNDLFLSSLCSI
jgi:hypothetical protein